MKPVVRSLSTSSLMIFCLSEAKGRFSCLTDLTFGLMLTRWVIIFEEISGMSVTDQAKISALALSNFINCCRFESDNCDPIRTVFSGSSFFNGMEISCLVGSPLSWFSLWSNLLTGKKSLGLFFGWRQGSNVGRVVDLYASLRLHILSEIRLTNGISKPLPSEH